MFLFFLFLGVFILLTGLASIFDTIIWKIETGKEFINFGIFYSEARHTFFVTELVWSGFYVLSGIIILLLISRQITRCPQWGKLVLKNQNFCHKCGNDTQHS